MFPLQRNRRLRTNESIRSLVRETSLSPQDFMLPMFVAEGKDVKVMLKLSLPTITNYYSELMTDPHVVRVVALSGGYGQDEANQKLSQNQGLIASFSRALSEGLSATQSDDSFNSKLEKTIQEIYAASIT